MRKEQRWKKLRREVVDYKRRSRKGIRLLEVDGAWKSRRARSRGIVREEVDIFTWTCFGESVAVSVRSVGRAKMHLRRADTHRPGGCG
jgi:hypothetical protein